MKEFMFVIMVIVAVSSLIVAHLRPQAKQQTVIVKEYRLILDNATVEELLKNGRILALEKEIGAKK